ncbi:MHS family alpha-ketoglutarate permease-like MFS transporter [Saccharopolyspora erythraea NRRL 2338]|uniref:Alpha-ketoglutarate transporter, MFS superfamily n=2 Tax=Saccharopolyspora erythraea TaxID=1836 RepID=A4FLD9_SACEN|nr:MFS transporter [Saccharopolyspora erythraea]EQD82764.1 major facilitator transporter [Saccharopolyspora erythraea D]PFG98505.1 MHS family alpha-ketoglutarate permease-like MFS transporter [Saccharopolyspora erythraea NRRL 2338]QRK88556.1 MFS transporter [Saccharopolyspora erythraea]CAM04864.1 alpha-ketoglutarate transporter, MFS superfamily [Saccharopolyspora erythraea NRRL 2338]
MTRTDVVRPGSAARARGGGRRELLAGAVGAAVESFDWTIYAVMAPYFASQMFAGDDELTKLLAAYAGFAVSFVVRPLGSYLFGRLADSRGRRFALVASMGTICLGSLLISALPTAASIGIAAPVLLVLLRAVQGVAMGGEPPSVAAYITETAPKDRRFLYSGLSHGGVIVGNVLCFAVVGFLLLWMGERGVADGGWRLGFVFAALFGLLAFWVRRTAAESGAFERAATSGAAQPVRVRAHVRNMVAVFLMTTGTTVGYYFGTTYLPAYAAQVGVAHAASNNLSMIPSLLVLLVAMAVSGLLADRFGGMRVFRAGVGMLVVITVPVMAGLAGGVLPLWAATVIYLVLGVGPTVALVNVLFTRMFPVGVRVVCMGLPYTLAVALFGGTFPMVAQALGAVGLLHAVPWVAASLAAVSLAGTAVLKREAHESSGPA